MHFRDTLSLMGFAVLAASVSQPAWPQARISGHPAQTETGSTADELSGIVVLCNQQNADQNACVPPESSDGGAGDVPRTGIGNARQSNTVENPLTARGLNPQPEPPSRAGAIVSANSRAAFAALNGYDRARESLSRFILARIADPDPNAELPADVTEAWTLLATDAAGKGNDVHIDTLAWSLIEDAMQQGSDETRAGALRFRVGAPANARASLTERERGPGAAAGRRTFEPIRIPADETLATVGDDAQLANIDLQNALQKQQQTNNMISNMQKMLHDTAMAVIRKIGG